ncbi:hypothetical protein Nm8I071_19950 [Nonomuraea sp. TT08I-71]|nr:hypothetical protein Nm8I071_19950 [Nonomuraea sp. TT08I-71]
MAGTVVTSSNSTIRGLVSATYAATTARTSRRPVADTSVTVRTGGCPAESLTGRSVIMLTDCHLPASAGEVGVGPDPSGSTHRPTHYALSFWLPRRPGNGAGRHIPR